MARPRFGGEGHQYPGPPKAALSYWLAGSIWALHKTRQCLESLGRIDRAQIVSALIRELEALSEDTNPGDD